ncbi:MAG: hypothetical protein J5588_09290 [Bacteroidales bacterium]|nr:hypothetical protein [Bacteroidales bacterium]
MMAFLMTLTIALLAVAVLCLVLILRKKVLNDYQKKADEANEFMKSFWENENKKRESEQKIENAKITIPLRIQAYERLVLLLERIKPESMLLRVMTPQMTAGLLHQELLITVRAEFEHNLSQQIYVSQESWNAVKLAKDSLVRLINEEAAKIAAGAPATNLSEAILTQTITQQINPIQNALSILKKDAENFM